MTVAVPVPLTEEDRAALLALAKAQGVPLDSLLREAVLRVISTAREVRPEPVDLSFTEWEKAFDEWMEESPDVPHLPEEALRQESIYHRD